MMSEDKKKMYNNLYGKSIKFSPKSHLLRIHVISWIVSRYPNALLQLQDTVIAGKFHRKSWASGHRTKRGRAVMKSLSHTIQYRY